MQTYRRTLSRSVSDLTRAQLNYAVAIAMGIKSVDTEEALSGQKNAVFSDGVITQVIKDGELLKLDWSLAGKLIEEEKISVIAYYTQWQAMFVGPRSDGRHVEVLGRTALEAIFKCFVEKKLGKFIPLPTEFD